MASKIYFPTLKLNLCNKLQNKRVLISMKEQHLFRNCKLHDIYLFQRIYFSSSAYHSNSNTLLRFKVSGLTRPNQRRTYGFESMRNPNYVPPHIQGSARCFCNPQLSNKTRTDKNFEFLHCKSQTSFRSNLYGLRNPLAIQVEQVLPSLKDIQVESSDNEKRSDETSTTKSYGFNPLKTNHLLYKNRFDVGRKSSLATFNNTTHDDFHYNNKVAILSKGIRSLDEILGTGSERNSYLMQESCILNCSGSKDLAAGGNPKQKLPQLGKPSEEQLAKIGLELKNDLPNLFNKPFNYHIYSKNIIFENRIRGTKSVGLFSYVKQVSFMRLIGHIKFAFVRLDILKITQHPEDGTVRVRWRIVGISALKSFTMVLKLKSYSLQEAKENMDEWYDGFSTFYVGSDGCIYKHIADKMMPDEELGLLKKPSLAARLASLLGLHPKTASESAVTSSGVKILRDDNNLNKKSDIVSILLGDVGNNVEENTVAP